MRELMARLGRWLGFTRRVSDLTDEEERRAALEQLERDQARLKALDTQVDVQTAKQHGG